MTKTKYTFCRICEAGCGLKLTVDANRIQSIEPDENHVNSKGYACIKGLSLEKFIESPDRLTQPLKKVGNEFIAIAWDQALKEIGQKMRDIHRQHGGQSIAVYTGNPIGFSLWPNTAVQGFLNGVGSDKLFTIGTLDCTNKFAAADRMYGSFANQTFPDISHTQMLIAVGSNPKISRMSFISLPHPMAQIEAIEKRGGEVIWINPRKTESAKQCGKHMAIRPDSDVFFMLGFLNELIRQNGVNHDRVAQYMEGYQELAELAKPWTVERVEKVSRIPAIELESLVTRYINADGAAIYSSTGVNQGRFGMLAFWLQESINAISGNLDKRGGTLMGKPVIAFPDKTKEAKFSRINNTPYITSGIPTGILADEILTPGEGQVKALFVVAGNPIMACANSDRVGEAFEKLQLMVSIDLYRNESANYADYVLPGLHFLERPDVPFFFMTAMGLMPDRYFHYTDAVLTPPGETRDEALILRQILRVSGFALFGSRLLQSALNLGEKLSGLPGCKDGVAERFCGLIARSGKRGGLGKLRKYPHGQLLDANQPGDYLGQRVDTDSKRIQLAPAEFVALAHKLEAVFEQEITDERLKLISKRERYSHNSWTHNVSSFVKGPRSSNYLYIHPTDAKQRQLAEGDMAEVCAHGKCIQVPVKLDSDFMPGTVSVPHGWGHQQADGLTIAKGTQGANVNILASDGPESIEPISGMSQLNGIPVEVRLPGDCPAA
jgi:anaerobic selenocysteine-containing dehydrogenase